MRILRKTLLEEDDLLNSEIDEDGIDEIKSDDGEDLSAESEADENLDIAKSKRKKKNKKVNPTLEEEEETPEITEIGNWFFDRNDMFSELIKLLNDWCLHFSCLKFIIDAR